VLIALLPGVASALTRDIVDLQPAKLTFERSVLNQLTYGTYREPFDELQTRPYNLLFTNIGRHANMSPWVGQEGAYRRYVNAFIGNNGVSNVDNNADALQGSVIRRESSSFSWGASAAFLAGNDGSTDSNATSTFADIDDLNGYDLRGSTGLQLSERRVLGAGVRVIQANSELTDNSFLPGVGGFTGAKTFDQTSVSFDVGLRQFQTPGSSWEARVVAGLGTFQQNEFSEDLDDVGNVTDRFVIRDYDVNDLSLAVIGGYNRLNAAKPGETEYRVGLEYSQRDLNNSDLSYNDSGGVMTPNVSLLAHDPVATARLFASARSVFQAGHTEMFTGAQLGYGTTDGSTQVDAGGTIVSEVVSDSELFIGLIMGLRQPLFHDKLRFIVSGRADVVDLSRSTVFEASSDINSTTQTTAQYAIGLEGVLANVTFDLAWLSGQEEPIVPMDIGLPTGSRRVVELDRLIVSAAVSW
jgi:hypothetical protein